MKLQEENDEKASQFLVFALLAGVLASSVSVTSALDAIEYVDENGETQTITSYTVVNSSQNTWISGWYAVTADTTISDRITCTGDVNLILSDGAELTDNSGIEVNQGESLTIYGQEKGTGMLKLDAADHNAALGGGVNYVAGTITINGGNVTAKGGLNAAGIGGGVDPRSANSVSLSGTNETDSIKATRYDGTVTLSKQFYDGRTAIPAGIVSDNGTIDGKTLTPIAT